MLLLGLDTATSVTAVALAEAMPGGEIRVLASRQHDDPRRHGDVLPLQIRAVLDDAGVGVDAVGAVGVGVGPGAFTGLRVGIATAQALGQALSVPVHGVCTLDALAFVTARSTPFAVVTDARRRELFWAEYDDAATPRSGPQVGPPDQVAEALRGLPVIAPEGTPAVDGVDYLRCEDPSGGAICASLAHTLAAGDVPRTTTPLYLRRPDVTPSNGPKSVIG